MRCSEKWSVDYYTPPNITNYNIIIDQVVPKEMSFYFSWSGGKDLWNVFYRSKGSEDTWNVVQTNVPNIEIFVHKTTEEYEFYVECGSDVSMLAFVRTGYVPGTVVNYLHPEDTRYAFSGGHLCSPSLLAHPDGYLLASMDLFGRGTPQNLTMIFRSDDNGESWYHYTELFPCFWGTLFLHKGEVYMLGTSTEYGDLLIGKSYDGGKNWTRPTVIARGSCHKDISGWHKSAVPVVEYDGRIWCGVDYGGRSLGGYLTCMASADANGDLLDVKSWTITEPLPYNPEWEGAVKGDNRGFLEGNAVVIPGVGICDMLRYSTESGEPRFGLAGVLRADSKCPEKALELYKFAKFDGNMSKFYVQRDEQTGLYFSIFSRITEDGWVRMRNLLSLGYSRDIVNWTLACDLIDYTDGDPHQVAFQYPSFCFDGDDIIYLSRTAFNGAKNCHDNNYVTFHRIKNFRKLIDHSGDCNKGERNDL